ncbi:hypothetical protein SKAU_G00310480 [Synaphobranchus kaupii]|uniref:Uncharacterized protein n=1 Tax=Synaphobranchus kaupii TaxID=118154 RepID=A0A9Q1IJ32_SYNKA|nr:hypothetical protein SKAU_G00310480 [Synaphobranchus kaupii]
MAVDVSPSEEGIPNPCPASMPWSSSEVEGEASVGTPLWNCPRGGTVPRCQSNGSPALCQSGGPCDCFSWRPARPAPESSGRSSAPQFDTSERGGPPLITPRALPSGAGGQTCRASACSWGLLSVTPCNRRLCAFLFVFLRRATASDKPGAEENRISRGTHAKK